MGYIKNKALFIIIVLGMACILLAFYGFYEFEFGEINKFNDLYTGMMDNDVISKHGNPTHILYNQQQLDEYNTKRVDFYPKTNRKNRSKVFIYEVRPGGIYIFIGKDNKVEYIHRVHT